MTVRVQLPAGAVFERALIEAASKFALRQDISDAAENDFLALVELAARAVNSTEPKSIELVLDFGGQAISASVHGIEPSAPMSTSRKALLGDRAAVTPPASVVIVVASSGD